MNITQTVNGWFVDNTEYTVLYENPTEKHYIIINTSVQLSFIKIEKDKIYKWENQQYEIIPGIITYYDDNNEIMNLLKDRLALGKERYGHGVRIGDDTREWGTDDNSWETMMLEEALDGMIYAAACLIKVKRLQKRKEADVSSAH